MDVIIRAGADVNTQDKMGYSPLMHASEEGYEKCVQILIRAGADVNLTDDTGYTALIAAAGHGNDICVHMLINAGADVNALVTVEHVTEEWLSCQSTTPLISAAGSRRCLDLLIEAGAEVNHVNDEGNTALITASSLGNHDCMDMLIHAGADVNICNKKEETALMLIGQKRKVSDDEKLKCLQLLILYGAYVNVKNKSGKKAIECHKASNSKIMRMLSAAGETIDEKFIHTKVRSLKHLSRDAIRRHLLEANPVNLYVRIRLLQGELPSSLCRYLLYNVSL